MSDQKIYQAVVRPRSTPDADYQPVTYSGQRFYSDVHGLFQLQQMTAVMASAFPQNEYALKEVTL